MCPSRRRTSAVEARLGQRRAEGNKQLAGASHQRCSRSRPARYYRVPPKRDTNRLDSKPRRRRLQSEPISSLLPGLPTSAQRTRIMTNQPLDRLPILHIRFSRSPDLAAASSARGRSQLPAPTRPLPDSTHCSRLQIMTILSSDPLARNLPSVDQRTQVTAPVPKMDESQRVVTSRERVQPHPNGS
jgi:hypothetical protein